MSYNFAEMSPLQEARARGVISGSAFRGQDAARAWFTAGRRAEAAYVTGKPDRDTANNLTWTFFEGFQEGFAGVSTTV